MSLAEEAKKYDPYGCSLPKLIAINYWKESIFIDSEGNPQVAYKVSLSLGILSVIFADGSILCPTHWQS